MAGNVQEKQLRWYNIALMSFITVWGFGNVVNNYANQGLVVVFSWVFIFALYFTPYALIVGQLGSTFKDGKGGVSTWIKHTMGPGLAYLAAWTYWVVHIPYLAQKPQAILIALGWAMKGDGSLIKEYSVVALQGLTLVLFIFFMWVASRGMKSLKIVGSVAGIAMFVMSLLYVAMAVTAPAITEVHIATTNITWETFIPHIDFTYITTISMLVFAVGGAEKISPYVNQTRNPGKEFPKGMLCLAVMVLLQFEDFAQKNAMPLLNRYRNEICSFNDDIQGTAAVTVGTLIAASRAAGGQLSEKKIVFLGAGSAGCGIAEMIIAQTQREGLSEEAARQKVFMVDRFGLLTDKMPNLLPFQTKLVQKRENLSDWDTDSDVLSLLDVVRNVKPDILIGVSGQTGLFTEEIIREMHKHCPRPIVMPLSNPTSRVEATPQDIIAWTEGNALVATGSPFNPVVWKDKIYPIAQCNNAFIFPGIGLGVIASGASRITDEMLMSASETLAQYSPLVLNGEGMVLPELKDIQKVSRAIAFAVGKMAQQQGVAVKTSAEALQQAIDDNFWQAEYRDYRRTSI